MRVLAGLPGNWRFDIFFYLGLGRAEGGGETRQVSDPTVFFLIFEFFFFNLLLVLVLWSGSMPVFGRCHSPDFSSGRGVGMRVVGPVRGIGSYVRLRGGWRGGFSHKIL